MAIEIKVPSVGESITEVTLVKWIKKDGDWVERDEVIAELESEKATFEINAEEAGVLKTVAAELNRGKSWEDSQVKIFTTLANGYLLEPYAGVNGEQKAAFQQAG